MIKQYKNYLKIRKIIMTLSKMFNKLATVFTQIFIIIGVLFVVSEIVDRVSTHKYLKEYGIGKIEKEDTAPKKTKV